LPDIAKIQAKRTFKETETQRTAKINSAIIEEGFSQVNFDISMVFLIMRYFCYSHMNQCATIAAYAAVITEAHM